MLGEMSIPSYLFPAKKADMENKPFDYLIDKLDLKEIVSKLCKKLHHPVALIDYNALIHTNEPEKLESMVEMYPMRRSCSVFRKCAGDEYCTECDRFHAKFMDVDKQSIDKKLEEYSNKAPEYFYPEYWSRLPIVYSEKEFNRPVIEYHCPMLGYRELLFPLMYKNILYGVFFAGQIRIDDEEDNNTIKTISDSFFNNNKLEDLFKRFVDGYNKQISGEEKLDYNKVKTLIINSDDDAWQYDDILSFRYTQNENLEYFSKTFSSTAEYKVFIHDVCNAIKKAEDMISSNYEEKRKEIISEQLKIIADNFFEEYGQVHTRTFKNKHELRTEELKSSWKALKGFLIEIQRQFTNVERIILFGDKQGIKIENSSKKEMVFFVPSKKEKKGSFDFSHYSVDGIGEYTDSLNKPEILDGISVKHLKENSILILCHDIAMLMLVKDLEENKKMYASMVDAIGEELVRINSIIALCSANLTKEKYLLTLRMYRHENAHISTRLMDSINRYFKNNGKRFMESEEEKRKLICDDMKNTVQLISNIADNIGFVTGSDIVLDKKPQDFDVLNMLYKWQIMFRDELEIRNLEIIVCRGYETFIIGYNEEKYINIRTPEITRQNGKYGIAPKEIKIDSRLFELLVYNLVDNAVKYAYRGTNVYLIWSRLDDAYELSVTSYGPRMLDGDSMYGLYVRGNDERFLQGDGLGLYVVRKIAEILDLTVFHNSEKVSNFNVPLIPWYSKTSFTGVKGYTKIEDNKLTIDDEQQAWFAVNEFPLTKIQESNLTIDYLRKRIRMETWRTSFFVRIPIKN